MNCSWQMHATDQANMKCAAFCCSFLSVCCLRNAYLWHSLHNATSAASLQLLSARTLLRVMCFDWILVLQQSLLHWQIMRAHTHMMGNVSMQRTPLCMQHSTSLTACCLRSKHGFELPQEHTRILPLDKVLTKHKYNGQTESGCFSGHAMLLVRQRCCSD